MNINMINLSEINMHYKMKLLRATREFLNGVSYEYPSFNKWFVEKVVPQHLLNYRDIILALDSDNIAGVSIVKDIEEKKICTFRVALNYRHNGVGKALMERSFITLNADKPIITIPDNKVSDFDAIIRYYQFSLYGEYKDYYINGSYEFAYNGMLNEEIITETTFMTA